MIELAEAVTQNTVVSIYFLRVSLVLAGIYILTALWKNISASVKAATWRSGLIGLFFLPALFFTVPKWDFVKIAPKAEVIRPQSESTQAFMAPPNALRIQPASSPAARSSIEAEERYKSWFKAEKPFRVFKALAFLWLIGVCILIARWIYDQRLISRIRREGTIIECSSTNRVFEEVSAARKTKRRTMLLESRLINTPITLGVFRPIIVLPAASKSWSAEQLKAVFLHELAHINRFDYLFCICVQFICVLYWLNPLVWLAKARLTLEQEKACDDEVVNQGMLSLEYAEHLLSIAKWSKLANEQGRNNIRLVVGMAKEPMLKRRMRSILNENTPRNTSGLWKKGGVFFSVFCIILLVSAFTVQPEVPGFTYVWYEAEEGAVAHGMGVNWDEETSGSRYVEALDTYEEGASSELTGLTVRFKISEAGKYVIWGRILAPSRQENSFFVSVDGKEKVLWDTQGPDKEMTAQVWSWDRVRDRTAHSEEGGNPMAFHFDAGWHTLQIIGREKGTGLDRLLITNNLIYRPRGKGNTSNTSRLSYTWIEPENGTITAPMQKAKDASASNESFVWTPGTIPNSDGQGVTHLQFHVDQEGHYVIWGRVLAPTTSDNSFFIQVDNGRELLWDVYGPDKNNTAQAWWWDRVRDRADTNQTQASGRVFKLSKGWHTLTLRSREAGTRIDRILVTNDDLFIPEGWGTSPNELKPINLWMEAEDAMIRKPLGIGRDPGASNGGYIEVTGPHQSTSKPPEDGHANFYVDVPVSGTYLLWGRVRAPASGDSFWLRIDGKRWIRWNGIQNGPGWHWEEVHDNVYNNRVLSLELQAGVHLIELAYRETNTKLDGLLLTNDLNYVPASTLHEPVVQKREILVSAFRN